MITITYANMNDGYIRSSDASYSTAISGNNRSVTDDANTLPVGQYFDGSFYRIFQSFVEFTYTAPSDSIPVAGSYILTGSSSPGAGVVRAMFVLDYDWGAAIDNNADWQSPAEITAKFPSEGILWQAQKTDTRKAYVGLRDMSEADSTATLQYVMAMNRNRLEQTPTGDERNFFFSADVSGTSSDPVFEVSSVSEHAMDHTLGAQVQLSDGTHMYLEPDAFGKDLSFLRAVHHNGTTATTAATFDFEGTFDEFRGAQGFAMCRDDQDNIYSFSLFTGDANRLYCRILRKGSGHNWTIASRRSVPIVFNDEHSWTTSLACGWHDVGGADGTVLVVGGRNMGRQEVGRAQAPYLLLDARTLLNDGSSPVNASGRTGDIGLTAEPSAVGYWNLVNPTGTLLDVCASPFSDERGYIISAERNQLVGQSGRQSVGRYILNNRGDGFVDANSTVQIPGTDSVKDADSKSRIIGISDNRFVVGTVSDTEDEGITVTHVENSGTSSRFDVLSQIRLDDESIASMPGAATLATSQAWDMFYNAYDNSVWVYYFDTADDQRLMRTQVLLSTGQATQSEVEVDASVGASGSTNHAIRVHRGNVVDSTILISVANETSGGDHSLLHVVDDVNAVPTQPTLTSEPNYDADDSAIFEWTFNDPDPNDTQSAYQLQINNASTGASAYDTGKTVATGSSATVPGGTLSNGVTYQWRVRTWDEDDAESPWSDYGTFTTSNTGAVTITDPAADNDGTVLTSDYTIQWEVTGATPDEYQVVVTRTSDNTTHSDTGRVTSTDTHYGIVGMLSDEEYLVEVTTWESDVASNTATRRITPDYDEPEVPDVSASVVDSGGYILIAVENPDPQGDRPEPDYNEIYRRVADSGTKYLLVGRSDINESFRDYSAASGVEYEYKVRAVVL